MHISYLLQLKDAQGHWYSGMYDHELDDTMDYSDIANYDIDRKFKEE